MRPSAIRFGAIPLAGLPVAVLVLGAEVVYAAHRRLPRFTDLDPSGTFGDPSAPPLRVVAIGDSSVTGAGLDRAEPIWVRRVAEHLAERYRVELVSLAVGGSKVRDVLDGQLPEALHLEPDLVLLSVGANDALRGTPLRRFEDDLEALLRAVTEAGAAVTMLGVGDLGTIPRLPPPLNHLARFRARRIDRIEAAAAARYRRVTKGESWDDETCQAFRTRPELFAPDLFHASAEGHALWARLAIPAVELALAG